MPLGIKLHGPCAHCDALGRTPQRASGVRYLLLRLEQRLLKIAVAIA